MATRSLGFISVRRALRHSASRDVISLSAFEDCLKMFSCCVVALDARSSITFALCSAKCSISSFSRSLKVPMRLSISSQSTRSPSNSGPSMHTNFVFPPIVSRHAPHIPVPSTIMVLSETVFGMLYFCAISEVNFIITGGPIAIT